MTFTSLHFKLGRRVGARCKGAPFSPKGPPSSPTPQPLWKIFPSEATCLELRVCLAGSRGGFEATPQRCSRSNPWRGREGWSSPPRPSSDVGCEDGARRDFIRTHWGQGSLLCWRVHWCLLNSPTALTDEETGSGRLRGLLYLHHKPRAWGREGATLGEDVGCPSAIVFPCALLSPSFGFQVEFPIEHE